MRRLVGLLCSGALVSTLLSACSFSARDLPLPGGAATGDDVYRVTVEFKDVLDLVPRSSVKVDDVNVGEVEEIWLDGYTAKVRLRVRDSVELPDNATANIRQTSLLGEKFVSLAQPPRAKQSYGELGNGDVIPLQRTGRNVEVEEVFSALSLLLHGGGVAQLKTINKELNNALEGRESSIRELLRQLEAFLSELDSNKREITRAIENLDRLSASLAAQKETLGTAIDEIPPALTILADQRKDLTKLLVELSRLGQVGTRVIEGSREDLLANLRALDPILTELAKSGDHLPNALEVLFTYPFSDSVANAVAGDYTNLQLTLDLDLKTLLEGKGPIQLPTELPEPTGPPTNRPRPTDGPVPTSTPGPTGDPTTPPDDDDDDFPLPCLPLLCPDGANASARQGTSAPYDPDVAVLLLGGLR